MQFSFFKKKCYINYIHSFLLSAVFICISTSVKAQITPDNTLGAEVSRINQNVLIKGANSDVIDGGAQRGSNLFHSFSQFNINDGQRLYFVNPTAVTNILTRVTGSNASNILGTLGVDGGVNLFLMNPNGILFGKNASLDIGGSFVGTTANGLQFGNQGTFGATNPSSPGLLTINPSAFLFNQLNPGNITNLSQAPAGINPRGNDTNGLRVPDGKSFTLVGGNINFDGGKVRAFGGRVELAGVMAPSSIGLNVAGDVFSLNVGNNLQLADISLSNGGVVSVMGHGGGDIVVNARNLFLTKATLSSSNFSDGSGGDINVNTGAVRLDNKSTIESTTNSGKGGNIKLNATDYLLLRRNSNITTTAGSDNKSGGNGGNITIQAPFIIAKPNENNNISANAFTGNGGKVNIHAQSIFGIDARPKLSDTDVTNTITASSKFGVQGSVRSICSHWTW